MAYLIQGAREAGGDRENFFVRNKKIAYMSKGKRRFKHMKVDCSGFVITPGRVGTDLSIMDIGDTESFKNRCTEWQERGCTTVLTVCSVSYEKQVKRQLRKARHHMINSSMDYVIGVSFPMRKLTPSFVRICKREQVPFIIASLDNESDIDTVAWPWIRNELFPYRPVIVPDFRKLQDSGKELDKLWEKWRQLAQGHELSTLSTLPNDGDILTHKTLRKIGISPLKGELLIGADLDYNLYQDGPLADYSPFYYDEHKAPDIVVAKGKVMKAGGDVFFRPGFGQEISVRVPGHFTTY